MIDVSVLAPEIRASTATAARSVKNGPLVSANFAGPAASARLISLEDLKAKLARRHLSIITA